MDTTAVTTQNLLRKRLLQDIAELQTNPYPGISLHIEDENALEQACLVLTPADQPSIHLTIIFGARFPLSPPSITIQSHVEHPNVFGDYICASILNTREGYTSAYTLKGICIQILSFFGSATIDQIDGDGTIDLKDFSAQMKRFRAERGGPRAPTRSYVCQKCGFGAARTQQQALQQEQDHPMIGDDGEQAVSAPPVQAGTGLVILPAELLFLICEHLGEEELVLAARAWNGFESIMRRVIRTRELQCFTLREGFKVTTLGIGVHVERKMLESEFELVSQLAFSSLGVRQSIHGLPFEHWMPLPLFENHWKRVRHNITGSLNNIAAHASIKGPPVTVIYAFMNDIVVRLSQEVNKLESGNGSVRPGINFDPRSTLNAVSERAIESYFHLFHLLLCLATEQPSIVQDANQKIKNFLNGKTDKQSVPNLGHLLVMVLIADVQVTQELTKAIVKETITRNVVWMLDSRGANMPELSFMESDAISEYRLQKTFEAGRTSYRLLMIAHLMKGAVSTMTTTPSGQRKTLKELSQEMFDRHGEPPSGAASHLADAVRRIQSVGAFHSFLLHMGLGTTLASMFTGFLKQSVYDSVDKGYSQWALKQPQALALRLKKEPRVGPAGVQPEYFAPRGFTFFPQRGGGGRR